MRRFQSIPYICALVSTTIIWHTLESGSTQHWHLSRVWSFAQTYAFDSYWLSGRFVSTFAPMREGARLQTEHLCAENVCSLVKDGCLCRIQVGNLPSHYTNQVNDDYDKKASILLDRPTHALTSLAIITTSERERDESTIHPIKTYLNDATIFMYAFILHTFCFVNNQTSMLITIQWRNIKYCYY